MADSIPYESPAGHAPQLEALSRSRCCRGSGPASSGELLRADEDGPEAPAPIRETRFSGSAPLQFPGARLPREPRQEGEHLRPARSVRSLSDCFKGRLFGVNYRQTWRSFMLMKNKVVPTNYQVCPLDKSRGGSKSGAVCGWIAGPRRRRVPGLGGKLMCGV